MHVYNWLIKHAKAHRPAIGHYSRGRVPDSSSTIYFLDSWRLHLLVSLWLMPDQWGHNSSLQLQLKLRHQIMYCPFLPLWFWLQRSDLRSCPSFPWKDIFYPFSRTEQQKLPIQGIGNWVPSSRLQLWRRMLYPGRLHHRIFEMIRHELFLKYWLVKHGRSSCVVLICF